MKILIVDDELVSRTKLKEKLTEEMKGVLEIF